MDNRVEAALVEFATKKNFPSLTIFNKTKLRMEFKKKMSLSEQKCETLGKFFVMEGTQRNSFNVKEQVGEEKGRNQYEKSSTCTITTKEFVRTVIL